ncbi:phospholipase D-like domain-containing protein [Wukongibacter baidiensis]
MIDCETNRDSEIKLYGLIETVLVLKFGKYMKNSMHNKFCIFELSTVISSSYNWSSNANFNYENIVIILEEVAKKFTYRFNKLISEFKSNE